MQLIKKLSTIMAWPLLIIIKLYQLFVSPLIGQNCRFYPTCSCYAHQALKRHGAFKGGVLTIKRIVKCNPMHPGGIDEVPPLVKRTTKQKPQATISNNKLSSVIKSTHTAKSININ